MQLLFVGDVMLGRLVNEYLEQVPPHYPWGDTLPFFQAADVVICNLECALADSGVPWKETPKVFHFRSDSRNVAVLQTAGIDLVSLANNHALDSGYEALYEMFGVLDRAGIAHAGAGRNVEAARQPAICLVDHVRVGCLAFTDNEPPWEATAERPGVFHVPVSLKDARAQALLNAITLLRPQVDWLIVSAHWGPNWGERPRRRHVPFAHALVEHGADIVFGHSCHTFQGIELYQSKPILYSCGDFIDDYRVDERERNDQSFLFIVETEGHRIQRLRLYPTVIRRFRASLAEGEEARAIAGKMRRLCADLNTASVWNAAAGYLEIPIGPR